MGFDITQETNGTQQYIVTTVAGATSLMGSNSLIEGSDYLVTDFQTIFQDPTGPIWTGPVEPLVLTAVSNDQFAPQVASLSREDDVIEYEITSQSITLGFTAAVEYDNSVILGTPFYSECSNLVATLGSNTFSIQLNAPLDYDAAFAMSIFNFNTGGDWSTAGSINSAITAGDITVVDNGGNNYSITVLILASGTDPFVFDNDYYIFNITGTSLLAATKGRITYRFDPINNIKRTVGGSTIPYDTADWRGSQLVRFYGDPSADFPMYSPGYISYRSSDLINTSAGTRGSVVNTVVVNAGDSDTLPIFASTAKDVDVNNGIIGKNATFGSTVNGYRNWGVQNSAAGIHYNNVVIFFDIGLGTEHYGLYLGSILGVTAVDQSQLYSDFFSNSLEDMYLNNGKLGNLTGVGSTLYNFRISNGRFHSCDVNQVMRGLYITGTSVENNTLDCIDSEIFNTTIKGANNFLSDCNLSALTFFRSNTFELTLNGATYAQINVDGGDIMNNNLRIDLVTSTINIYNMVSRSGHIRELFDITSTNVMENLMFFGGDFKTVLCNEDMQFVEFHYHVEDLNLNGGGLNNVRFFKEINDLEINGGSIQNSNVFCPLITRVITTNVVNDDIVGISADNKIISASYGAGPGFALITTEVL